MSLKNDEAVNASVPTVTASHEQQDQKFRSTKPVSILFLTKRLCERISRQMGIVVLIGSITNSRKALFIVAMASLRVGLWTMTFAIIES